MAFEIENRIKMGSYVRRKIEYLIVDTSAFINNAAVQELGENILTVPEVVEEIKSKRQLRRLVVLPYDISVKEAHPENIKFVSEFSKKTGDYISLSATDINVIALTYQLEKEKNGYDHLKTAPVCKPTICPISTIPEDLRNIAGFYVPKKARHSGSKSNNSDDECSVYESAEDEEFDSAEEGECETQPEDVKKEIQKETNINEQFSKNLSEVEDEQRSENDEDNEHENDEENDDNDDEWITPSNIAKVKNKLTSEVDEDLQNISVACLTTDFAMQNVLKQIGLQVMSLDGKVIKQLRTFVLRCYGCFKTTSIMTKVFCPNCGNKTLKKVGVSLNADGTQNLHINFRRPLTARGKRFSLPRPKGGKHSNNPILCEDQPVPQQRPSRLSKTKKNPLNDDYVAGFSPFATRDVYSKSAMLGIRPHVEMKHWMKRNPNEARRKKK